VYLNRVGEQCRDQARLGSQLCAYHASILEGRDLADNRPLQTPASPGARTTVPSRFPFIYRLAAALLLLIFIFNGFSMLRSWIGF